MYRIRGTSVFVALATVAFFRLPAAVRAEEAAPSIEEIEPTSGVSGATVYIGGSYFGSSQGAGDHVWFGIVNLIEAVASNWGDELIECVVPAGLPTTYPIRVTVETENGKSNGVEFQAT